MSVGEVTLFSSATICSLCRGVWSGGCLKRDLYPLNFCMNGHFSTENNGSSEFKIKDS